MVLILYSCFVSVIAFQVPVEIFVADETNKDSGMKLLFTYL